MNIPNCITIIRLALIPLFILIFFSTLGNHFVYAMAIFFLAGISDLLDGYIARKYNLITKIGIVLDPLADKLMLITVISCLVISNDLPIWVLLVIACKDLFMVIFGLILYKKNVVIPSNIIGKLSTFLFYLSMFVFVFNSLIGTYMIYISVGVTVLALINYSIIYFRQKGIS